ncbi:hypothetical protein NEOKW01_2014 [Nematocida sp. AWRm80]|nr:hypothetical protein NEOKW01_2014 [Nematocida sp. AWRm80]
MEFSTKSREPRSSPFGGMEITKKILYKCSIVVIGVALYFMFTLTVGEIMFAPGKAFDGIEAKGVGQLIFVIGTLVSQLGFFFFSSFDCCVLTAPISETFKNVQALHIGIEKSTKPENVFSTLIASLFLSSVGTGVGFLLLRLFNGKWIIKKIPPVISNAMFVVVGVLTIQYANERVMAIQCGLPKWAAYGVFNGIGAAFCLLAYFARKRAPIVAKYGVLFILGILLSAYAIAIRVYDVSVDDLVQHSWLLTHPKRTPDIQLPEISFRKVDWHAVQSYKFSILGISLLSIVQFIVNFPPIVEHTKQKVCIMTEMAVNGISNVLAGLVGTSSYMLASSTISVVEAGSKTRLDTLFVTAAFGGLFFLAHQYIRYIPFIIFDLILVYLGMMICLKAIISVVEKGVYYLAIVAVITAVSLLTKSLLWSACAAGIICVAFLLGPSMIRSIKGKCIIDRNRTNSRCAHGFSVNEPAEP